MPHNTELDGKAQFVVGASTQFAFETIGCIKCAMTDKAVFIYGKTQECLRLAGINQLPSPHSPTPLHRRAAEPG